jgi:putative MATE family efflux protein
LIIEKFSSGCKFFTIHFSLYTFFRTFVGQMKKVKNSELLLSYIREGKMMTQSEKLWLIVSLSIPSILAQISATVMFFIDASMVGHLGAKASAAIGLVETTGWLMGGLASAANMGFSVQVAHFIGANDFEAARRVLRQSMVCCLVWALMISLISVIIAPFLPYWMGGSEEIARDASIYFAIFGLAGIFFQAEGLAGSMLKCSGNMKIPSMLNIGMCVMDVIFNYLFIYILDLGVMGAAIGTGIAMLITAVLMLYFLLVKSKMLSLVGRPGSFKPKSDTVGTAFKIGAPMGLQHLLMGGAYIVSTMIVAPLGTIAIAAHSLAITVESLCYMPGYGIAEAATTLVGQGIGAGQKLLTRSFARMSVGLGIAVMTVMGVLMWTFAPELMSLMSPVEEVIAQGTQVLRIEAWAEPLFAAAIVCNGVFIGAGDTMIPAIMSLASMWAVRLTLAASLAPKYGLKGVWTAMAIELTFRGSIFLTRLFKGKWGKRYSFTTTST